MFCIPKIYHIIISFLQKAFFIGAIFLFQPVYSQNNQIQFRHLSVQNGLSRSWVKCIYQDRQGYLWVGTADGLNRYDGISFKTFIYKSGATNCINHNNIITIYEDKKGNIWIGTQVGLNLFNKENDDFISFSSINCYIGCIYEFSDDNFLIGSPGGLFLFNPIENTTRQVYNDINIVDILRDRNKNFWLTTYNGLLLLDTTDYSYILIKPDEKYMLNSNNLIHSIFQDSRGGIWLGTDSDGLWYMKYDLNDPQNPQFMSFRNDPTNPESISDGAIYAISEDEKGVLWIGIENGGISLLDLKTFPSNHVSFRHLAYNQADLSGISDNSIHELYHDRHNTMWVGTYGNGLNYHNKYLQKFDHYMYLPGSKNTINNNRVNTIFEEEEYLWIGTEGGLNVYNKRNNIFEYYRNEYNNPKSIGSNAIWSIYRDSRKNLWVGVWGGGLNLFNEQNKTFTRFVYDEKNPASIGSNSMVSIIETQNNELWIGTMRGGLNKFNYDTKTFDRFLININHENGISSNWVMDVLESTNGDIWVSTSQAVDVYNRSTNHFTTYKHNHSDLKSISYDGAICFFEDSRKNIWIGTSNGLNVFIPADSTFKHYFQSDGLPDNIIQSIEEDNHGNLWISTNNGISEFRDGIKIPEKPDFRNFNVSDGLQGNEFIGRCSFKNADGFIYFGGTNGYNVFNPDDIESNPYIPNIVFTGLLIFNKPIGINQENSPLLRDISVTKELKLTRNHSVFTIEFAALNLLAPENNQYAFILEGFEKHWNYVGKQHSATYTNLDPGKYTFRVKASNNDGLWNEKGIALDIVILPAWWQTWYARAVYLLIIIMGIYYFRKHTVISVNLKNELWKEHLEKQKSEELSQLKYQFFTNISHELRTPLTLIIGPLKQLMSSNALSSQIDIIYKNASRLKILVDQIMDFSKIENQMMKVNLEQKDLISLIDIEVGNFIQLASQKNISLRFKSSLSKCLTEIDEDKMIKILANILSNALKNTPENGKVMTMVSFDQKNNTFIIDISDTGQGISEYEQERIFDRFYTPSNAALASQGTGIGLNLTKKLVEMLRGKITVNSTIGQGSIFSIHIPVKPINIEYFEYEKQYTNQTREFSKNQYQQEIPDFQFEDTILIIDDNIEMCDFIESILCDEFNIIKGNNPLECFNHITKHLPDLIISDVMMPEIDGFELCRKVKSDIRFSHIPLILLTAKVGVEDQIAGYETGADDYIKKPFEGNVLKARVRNLIRQKENLRQHFVGRDGIINPKVQVNALDKDFMENIFNIIKEKYTDPEFSINQIIEKIGMSRSVFYKKFKSLSNQSINDLIKNFRLKKADELLAGGNHSVSQVAYDCGFSDPAYFSKVFKEYYKVAPKDYASNGNSSK